MVSGRVVVQGGTGVVPICVICGCSPLFPVDFGAGLVPNFVVVEVPVGCSSEAGLRVDLSLAVTAGDWRRVEAKPRGSMVAAMAC